MKKLSIVAAAMVASATFALPAHAGEYEKCLARCAMMDLSGQPACERNCKPGTPTKRCDKEGKDIPLSEWSTARCTKTDLPATKRCDKEGKDIPLSEWSTARCTKTDLPATKRCDKEGKDIPIAQWTKMRCDKPGGASVTVTCDAEKFEKLNADSTGCDCVDGYERYPVEGGSCVVMCKDGERHDPNDGVCKPAGTCEDPCINATNDKLDEMSKKLDETSKKLDETSKNVTGLFGDLSFWLKIIVGELGVILFLLILWFFGGKDALDRRREAKARRKAARAAALQQAAAAQQAWTAQQAAAAQQAVATAPTVQAPPHPPLPSQPVVVGRRKVDPPPPAGALTQADPNDPPQGG